jgi:hypothetical protein
MDCYVVGGSYAAGILRTEGYADAYTQAQANGCATYGSTETHV